MALEVLARNNFYYVLYICKTETTHTRVWRLLNEKYWLQRVSYSHIAEYFRHLSIIHHTKLIIICLKNDWYRQFVIIFFFLLSHILLLSQLPKTKTISFKHFNSHDKQRRRDVFWPVGERMSDAIDYHFINERLVTRWKRVRFLASMRLRMWDARFPLWPNDLSYVARVLVIERTHFPATIEITR